MPVANFVLGPIQTNCYVLHKNSNAIIIDVGGDPKEVLTYLDTNKLTLSAICITHLHFDHIYGVAALAEQTKAPVYVPQGDSAIADTEASKGGIWGLPTVTPFSSVPIEPHETIFADMPCRILPTPGHTPGSLSYYFPEEHCVFSGDALFYRSVGRTDFPLGDSSLLFASIRKELFALPGNTLVYPGHGPSTTIHDEKANNPFCGDFC